VPKGTFEGVSSVPLLILPEHGHCSVPGMCCLRHQCLLFFLLCSVPCLTNCQSQKCSMFFSLSMLLPARVLGAGEKRCQVAEGTLYYSHFSLRKLLNIASFFMLLPACSGVVSVHLRAYPPLLPLLLPCRVQLSPPPWSRTLQQRAPRVSAERPGELGEELVAEGAVSRQVAEGQGFTSPMAVSKDFTLNGFRCGFIVTRSAAPLSVSHFLGLL